MSRVEFYGEDVLRWWVEYLQVNKVKIRLPAIDEAWYKEMISCVEVTALNPAHKTDLHSAGASIFYKATKNHRRVDGNKRSAVICTYLFYIINSYHLRPNAEELNEFARSIAEKQVKQEECHPEIVDFLAKNSGPTGG